MARDYLGPTNGHSEETAKNIKIHKIISLRNSKSSCPHMPIVDLSKSTAPTVILKAEPVLLNVLRWIGINECQINPSYQILGT